jgi:hypothetical protein
MKPLTQAERAELAELLERLAQYAGEPMMCVKCDFHITSDCNKDDWKCDRDGARAREFAQQLRDSSESAETCNVSDVCGDSILCDDCEGRNEN